MLVPSDILLMLYRASGGTAIVGPMFYSRLTNSLSFFSTLVLFCLQHIASCMGDACWKEPVPFSFPAIFPESNTVMAWSTPCYKKILADYPPHHSTKPNKKQQACTNFPGRTVLDRGSTIVVPLLRTFPAIVRSERPPSMQPPLQG